MAGKASQGIPKNWRNLVAPYQKPLIGKAIFQVASTLVLLALSFTLTTIMLGRSTLLGLLCTIPTGLLLVRTFVLMHDCAHGSFLPWRRANDAVGFVTGVLTMTPFTQWRHEHAIHHASSGDLDRRGTGDITTLTVAEYMSRSNFEKFLYRLYRNPAILFGILGPLYIFFGQRIVLPHLAPAHRRHVNVWATNACILGLGTLFWLTLGPKVVLLGYVPAMYLAAGLGVFLFYIQHQFEDAYWEKAPNWDYATAALEGSSYLKLPPVLQWFTGSIGLHHVHHLGPKIPNYRLQDCHDENPPLQSAPTVTLADSSRLLKLALYDENRRRLISFDEIGAATEEERAAA